MIELGMNTWLLITHQLTKKKTDVSQVAKERVMTDYTRLYNPQGLKFQSLFPPTVQRKIAQEEKG